MVRWTGGSGQARALCQADQDPRMHRWRRGHRPEHDGPRWRTSRDLDRLLLTNGGRTINDDRGYSICSLGPPQ